MTDRWRWCANRATRSECRRAVPGRCRQDRTSDPRWVPEPRALPSCRRRIVAAVIESEEAAKRLARVIVSDIELYNREKFRAGADLSDAIRDGLALFRSRVAPGLVPIFETVLADKRGARGTGAAAPAASAAAA